MAAIQLRWQDDRGIHEQWATDQAPAVIGRGAGCYVRIAAPTVSRRHAELERRADGFAVRDLSGGLNPVLVNGDFVTDNTRVWSGDTIVLGKVTVEVLTVEGIAPPGMGPRMHLAWRLETQLFEQTVLGGDPMLLGRDPKCAIVFAPQSVSRTHAVISQDGGRFVIEDLTNGANPVRVNGIACERVCALNVGDEIRIGEVTLVVTALSGTISAGAASRPRSEQNVECPGCHRDMTGVNLECPYCGAQLVNAETIVR